VRLRLGSALATAITIAIGLIVLLGLLIEPGAGQLGSNVEDSPIADVTSVLLSLTTVLLAFMILVGVLNLLGVHLLRLIGRRRGAPYSLVLIIGFGAAVGTYIARRETSMVILETVQFSIESALAGLLLFSLVFGAYRMMYRRVTWTGVLFIIVVLIVLIGALPVDVLRDIEAIAEVRAWLMEVPVSAGARGILLGIALATIVAGMRVLIGQDRSYRG
jgi:hypothetical protein